MNVLVFFADVCVKVMLSEETIHVRQHDFILLGTNCTISYVRRVTCEIVQYNLCACLCKCMHAHVV